MKLEEELLRLLKKGDENSIKRIFETYYVELCFFARSIVKNHQVAEEIVEDLFVHLWLNSKSLILIVSLKSYLYRSVHNNCLKYLEKVKTQNKHLELLQFAPEKEEIHPVTSDYPLSILVAKELEQKAELVVESLPLQCRTIYNMNRYENKSYSEIATELNINVGTVKTQMSRAYGVLRHALKEYIPLIINGLFI